MSWGFCSSVSHVSTGKSWTLEASRVTLAIGGSGVEVGACHYGFCDSLATGLPGHDVVWVVAGQLTKSAHFLALRMTFTLEESCKLYIREIVQLHGVLVSIVSDRDPRLTTHFWESFQ